MILHTKYTKRRLNDNSAHGYLEERDRGTAAAAEVQYGAAGVDAGQGGAAADPQARAAEIILAGREEHLRAKPRRHK